MFPCIRLRKLPRPPDVWQAFRTNYFFVAIFEQVLLDVHGKIASKRVSQSITRFSKNRFSFTLREARLAAFTKPDSVARLERVHTQRQVNRRWWPRAAALDLARKGIVQLPVHFFSPLRSGSDQNVQRVYQIIDFLPPRRRDKRTNSITRTRITRSLLICIPRGFAIYSIVESIKSNPCIFYNFIELTFHII